MLASDIDRHFLKGVENGPLFSLYMISYFSGIDSVFDFAAIELYDTDSVSLPLGALTPLNCIKFECKKKIQQMVPAFFKFGLIPTLSMRAMFL